MSKNLSLNSSGLPSSNNFTANAYASNNLDEDDDVDDFETTSGAGLLSSPYKPTTSANNFTESSLLREDGKPSGLKNVGNTCWFNSIIQV